MAFTRIQLFETPLSPTYENVFDECTEEEYISFLNTNYRNINIPLTNKMSERDFNGTELTVKIPFGDFPFVLLRNYNYCMLDDLRLGISHHVFYFITDIKTANNDSNLTVTLSLEFDSWINNYLRRLYELNANTDVFIKRRHYKSYELGVPLQYTNADEFPTYRKINKPLNDNGILTSPNGSLLLWKKIIFNDNDVNVDWKGDVERNLIQYPLIGIYIPMAFVGINDDVVQYIPCSPTGMPTYEDREIETHLIYNGNDVPFTNYTPNQNVVSVEYTYLPPFNFECELTLGLGANVNLTTSIDYIKYISVNSKDGTPLATGFYSTGQHINLINEKIKIPYYVGNMFGEKSKDYVIENYLDIERDTSGVQVYPYRYKSLMFGSENIDLLPDNNYNTVNIKVNSGYGYNPRVTIGKGNSIGDFNDPNAPYSGYIDDISRTFSRNIYGCFNEDSYARFMQNNGATFETNRFLNHLNTAIGIGDTSLSIGKSFLMSSGNPLSLLGATDIAKSYINSIGQEALYRAKIKDLKNSIDNLTSVDNTNYDALFYGDAVYICNNYPIKSVEYVEQIKNLHWFGVFINKIENFYNNYHYDFDYMQIDDEFKFIPNRVDSQKLSTAFSNGVTRWHISSTNTEQVAKFNKNIINLSKELIQ